MVSSLYREKILIVLILLLVASTISGLPTGRAAGFPSGPGTVCLVDSSAVSTLSPPGPCSTGPYTFDAPYPSSPQGGPTQIRVGVYANGSDAIGGFTIILNSTHTILTAAGVDLTGSVLAATGTPQIFAECLDLVLVKGPACSGADTQDTLDLSAGVPLGASNTVAPTTGLLFTAIFNVTGTSAASGVAVEFAKSGAFCGSSSTTQAGQAGNYCVSVTKPPGTVPIAETVVTGTRFNNNACATTCSIPWIAVGSNVTQINVIQNAATGLGVSITATPENAWPGLSPDSITFTAVTTPSSFAAPTFVGGVNSCSPGGTSTPLCPVTMTVSSTVAGTYSVTIYGTYVAFDGTTVTDTLVGTESILVNVGSVSWTINNSPAGSGQALYMAKGVSNPMGLLFTVQSLGGYSGTITYATSIGGVGLTFAYPPTFTLGAGATITKAINVTAANYGNVVYKAKLTPSGLTVLTSGVLTVHVTGVSMSTNSTSVTLPSGGAAHVSVTVNSLPASPTTGFAGPVTVSNIISGPSGSSRLTVSCPTTISLSAGGSNSGTCSFAGSLSGSYTVTIKISAGANNAITNSTIVTATIQGGNGPGINLSANPVSITSDVNNLASSTITVVSRNGLTGTVNLLVTATGSATCSLNPTSITFGTSSTSVLSCNDAVPETVTATVTATNSTNPSITNSTDVAYIFQDFTISASPMSVPTDAGSAGVSTISVVRLNGFSDGIGIASNSTSCALSPTHLTGSASASLSCTFSLASTIHVTVTGTNGTLSHSVTITFTVHNFGIAANPTSVPASVGATGVSTITVSSLNGFAGTVSLTVGKNSTNLSCTLSSTSITGGSGSSTLSCSASVGGNYNATVTGLSGTLAHSVSVTYHVSLAPDFSIGASPTIVSVNVGAKGNSTITVAGFNSFNGSVNLTTNSTSCLFSSASVTGSGIVTLSCTFNSVSTVHVNVTGTSGTLSHSVVVTYTVQDFALTSSPASVTTNVSVAGGSTVTVAPANGFAGTVTLSVTENSTSLSCTVSPLSVTGGGIHTSSLSCISSIAGNYRATVTGVNGTLSHSTDVVYQVLNAPTFTVAASLTSVPVNAGASGTSTITVTSLNGFTGIVTLAVVTTPTSLSCMLSPTTITGGSGTSTLSCSSSSAGDYQATVTGTNPSVSPTPASAVVTFHVQDFTVAAAPTSMEINAGSTGSATITVAPVNGFAGTVSLSSSVSAMTGSPDNVLTGSFNPLSITGGSGTSVLTLTAKLLPNQVTAGNYTVTVTVNSGPLSHTSSINVLVGDFEITQQVSSISLNETTSGSIRFTFVSTNGFNGPVSLVGYTCLLSVSHGGTLCVPYSGSLPTASPSPATFNLSPSDSVDVQITIVVAASVIPNLWGVGVNATGTHSVVHVIELVVSQPIISIVSSPGSVTVGPGVNASMTVTITSLYGLSGTVTLALSPLTGASCSLSQNSVTLTKGGSATTGIACSGSVGSYNETITGTGTAPYGSTVMKNGHAGFSVVSFTLTPTPSGGITVNPGQNGHASLAIAWPGGYAGIVHFTLVPSSGLNASLTSTSLTGSGVVNVTVSSNLGGSYTLVVNATTGPVVNGVMTVAAFHVARLTVTVLSTSPAGNILGVDPTTFYSIVGLLVVVVAASVLLISRRGKSAKKRRKP